MLRLAPLALCALAVCKSPASDAGKPDEETPAVSVDPSPEWDRPMPFEDEGWFCNVGFPGSCVWSEEAGEYLRMFLPPRSDERPATVFCYSRGSNAERHCAPTRETCEAFRKGESRYDETVPCREMTPTEFWRENPMLVEVNRKICKPQECPSGYRWLGAAKIKDETLPLDESVLTDLGDGIVMHTPSSPNWPGLRLDDDRDCAYGCVLRYCAQDEYGCIDTRSGSCSVCEELSAEQCRSFVDRCRTVSKIEDEADKLCVFEATTGSDVVEKYRCRRGYTCQRVYDETMPESVRRRGVCEKKTSG